jgi:hypothetical protein
VLVISHQKDGKVPAAKARLAIENKDYCEALSFTGQALSETPWSARYLTAWASLKPLVDGSCSREFTSGDPVRAIETALSIHPLDFDVLLASASLYFERGEITKSYSLLARILTFDRGFSSDRIAKIMSMVRSREAVQAIFPAKFPQANTWRPILLGSRYPEVRAMADEILFAAVKSLSDFSSEIAEEHLKEVYSQGVKGDLRQEVDRVAARIFRERNSWNAHRYLAKRAELKEARAEFGIVDPETSFFRNQIIKWGAVLNLSFGKEPVSFGFFIPESAQYLELVLRDKMPRFESIKFFVSDDNENWSDTGFKDKPQIANIAGSTYVLLRLPDGVKYGKVFVQDERLKVQSRLLSAALYKEQKT